jgi:hypothetical protein
VSRSSTSRRIRRDEIASRLLRYRDGRGDDWADIIDSLTMYPEARRKVIRLLGEIDDRDA